MKMIIEFIRDINICYLILNILLIFTLGIYLKQKNLKKSKKNIILGAAIIVSFLLFSCGNSVVQSIFSLKYLSVKSYLLVIVIVNIITLFTINHRLKFFFELINYTFFIVMAIIFGSIIFITIGNYIDLLYIMDISNAITLMNLSFIMFIIYLIGISLIYISYNLFNNFSIKKMIIKLKNISLIIKEKVLFAKTTHKQKRQEKKKNENNISINNKVIDNIVTEKNNEYSQINILTPEELLGLEDKSNFYINGVECSIIFEDSIKENIIRNYHILLEDINAKMVNGFTLEENQLLRSICNKLQIYNLNNIDINNSNVLNRVSVEEYNFLMKVMGVN